MSASLLLSALLAGLVGGLHCAAMCGGFVAAISAREGRAPLVRARTLVARQASYHAGRVVSYSLLGAAFGAFGASTLALAQAATLQQILYVVANLLLLAVAAAIVWRTAGTPWLARAGLAAFGRALPVVRPLLSGNSAGGRVALGIVWGFVPCTLVYSVLPLALFAGGAWQGALVMGVFGLGTLPQLAGFGFILSRMRGLVGSRVFRGAAAALIAGFALAGLYRALFLPGSLGQGPFCL